MAVRSYIVARLTELRIVYYRRTGIDNDSVTLIPTSAKDASCSIDRTNHVTNRMCPIIDEFVADGDGVHDAPVPGNLVDQGLKVALEVVDVGKAEENLHALGLRSRNRHSHLLTINTIDADNCSRLKGCKISVGFILRLAASICMVW